jgi:hypothetical protein
MLIDSEQLEHLKLTATLAELKVPEIVLVISHKIVIHRMQPPLPRLG